MADQPGRVRHLRRLGWICPPELTQGKNCGNLPSAQRTGGMAVLTDLPLAILHHVVVFSIFAVYAVRVTFVRPGLDGEGTAKLAKFDAAYGGLAMLALVVGFARVFL